MPENKNKVIMSFGEQRIEIGKDEILDFMSLGEKGEYLACHIPIEIVSQLVSEYLLKQDAIVSFTWDSI